MTILWMLLACLLWIQSAKLLSHAAAINWQAGLSELPLLDRVVASDLFIVPVQCNLLASIRKVLIWGVFEEPLRLDRAYFCHELALCESICTTDDDKLVVEHEFGLQIAENTLWVDLQTVCAWRREIGVSAIELPLGNVREESSNKHFENGLWVIVVI